MTNAQFQPGELRPDGALEHGLLEGHHDQSNRFVPLLLVAAIAASGLSMIFSIGAAIASAATADPAQHEQSTGLAEPAPSGSAFAVHQHTRMSTPADAPSGAVTRGADTEPPAIAG